MQSDVWEKVGAFAVGLVLKQRVRPQRKLRNMGPFCLLRGGRHANSKPPCVGIDMSCARHWPQNYSTLCELVQSPVWFGGVWNLLADWRNVPSRLRREPARSNARAKRNAAALILRNTAVVRTYCMYFLFAAPHDYLTGRRAALQCVRI